MNDPGINRSSRNKLNLVYRPTAISPKRLFGAYYTPREVADELVRWAIPQDPGKVLDPSYGGCSFLSAAAARLAELGVRDPGKLVFGIDIDAKCRSYLRADPLLSEKNGLTGNFLHVTPAAFGPQLFRSIVGNPPYVRHHWLKGKSRNIARKLADGLAIPECSHIVARLHNLDWIFDKKDENIAEMVEILVASRAKLPTKWPGFDEEAAAIRQIKKLLSLSDSEPWANAAWKDVVNCQPPMHDLMSGGQSTVFLRWLLQLIFPYPCFLWDEHSVSAHLRISVKSFREAQKTKKFAAQMAKFKYEGLFSGFTGERWWRAGIENFAWKLSNSESENKDRAVQELSKLAGKTLETLKLSFPVVCRDKSMRPQDSFSEAESAVRLKPEFWPGFADEPWTSIELLIPA